MWGRLAEKLPRVMILRRTQMSQRPNAYIQSSSPHRTLLPLESARRFAHPPPAVRERWRRRLAPKSQPKKGRQTTYDQCPRPLPSRSATRATFDVRRYSAGRSCKPAAAGTGAPGMRKSHVATFILRAIHNVGNRIYVVREFRKSDEQG